MLSAQKELDKNVTIFKADGTVGLQGSCSYIRNYDNENF